jgi:hypothetical protein
MPITISDFKFSRAVVEGRYEDAFLIFDKTGAICRELKLKWPECNLHEASPAKTVCQNGTESYSLELKQCLVVSSKPDSSVQQYNENAEWFFRVVQEILRIEAYTRLGFRAIFRRECKSHAEAVDLFTQMKLLRLPDKELFGAGKPTSDLAYSVRFQSDRIGALVRIATETVNIHFEPPIGAEDLLKPIKKESHYLVYDVDYHTLGIVETAQLKLGEWVKQALHVTRRDSTDFLEIL